MSDGGDRRESTTRGRDAREEPLVASVDREERVERAGADRDRTELAGQSLEVGDDAP